MCDIEYEEIDNKEKIVKELRHILLEGESRNMENIVTETNLIKENVDKDRIYNKDKLDTSSLPSLSVLYSNYSKEFKEKLKAPPCDIDINLKQKNLTDNESNNDSIDTLELFSDSSNDSDESIEINKEKPKPQMAEMGCDSFMDEIKKSEQKKPSKFQNSCTDSSDITKSTVTRKLVDSGGSTFDDCNTSKISNSNRTFNIKKSNDMIDSSCGSGIITKPSINLTGTCIGTEVDNELEELSSKTVPKTNQAFSAQADNMYHELEQKIEPFAKNPHTVELKLRGRVSIFQKACIKQIADQNNLLMKQFGKGKSSYVLLRKKVKLMESQKLFLEIKKAEKEKQRSRVAQLKAKQEKLNNPPQMTTSSCQVDMISDEENEVDLSKRAKKKLKMKTQAEINRRKMQKSSFAQTAPDGFYVCPYCEDDIPETIQHIHYPFCLDKYRSALSNKKEVNNLGLSTQMRARSKSRERKFTIDQNCKIDKIKKELDQVHDNDIAGIINKLNELDKKCEVDGCQKKKFKKCEECHQNLCQNHLDPNGISGEHINCPVLLEKNEAEKMKRLGINNPLMKTVEQLRTPKIPNGTAARRGRRRRIRAEPTEGGTETPNANINQTRDRNGALLEYEKELLRKQLKEKISFMSGKRSK